MTPGRLLLLLACFALISCRVPDPTPPGSNPAITATELRQHVRTLASEAFQGRRAGTEGALAAAEYIAREFQRYGLQPGGDAGTWMQSFQLRNDTRIGLENSLSFFSTSRTTEFQIDEDYRPISFSANGTVDGPCVFVGYGIVAPELGHDDYAGINVQGHVVLILRHTPDGTSTSGPYAGYRALRYKIMAARDRGASGVLFVTGAGMASVAELVEFRQDMTPAHSGIPAMSVSRQVADQLLEATGTTLVKIQSATDAGRPPNSMLLSGTRIRMQTHVVTDPMTASNVVGWLPGNDAKYGGEVVVVGAHLDHLGNGGSGSLAKGSSHTHLGADDNASGTAGLLELAQAVAAKGEELQRSVLFIAFSAEELGLLGSVFYTENPFLPLDSTIAMVNLDMIGRLRQQHLTVGGTGTAAKWEQMLAHHNNAELDLEYDRSGLAPSDHASFYKRNIPVLFFHTGRHSDYHKPSDTVDKINFEGMETVVSYAENILINIQGLETRPDFIATNRNPSGRTRTQDVRHYLGVSPDYETHQGGVHILGLSPTSPAKVAGLLPGDTIIEVGDRRIMNIYDYLYALRAFERTDTLRFVITRDSTNVVLKVAK